ncbi:DUF3426 domain-containing protein [Luteimonas weifangensis]|uniref:DUF3426 domain-containing protein n=2 Tax=Cognatiluteimonas weifangensis TaxID=2303539 RepID=A0A372DQS2_9GAMM|nr:DUF3426 domain-containing protein [Luteimonas weifangensis]
MDAPATSVPAAPSPAADAVAAVVDAPAVDANDVDAPPVADTVDAVVDTPSVDADVVDAADADAVGAVVAATPPASTSTATPALPRMRRARAHRPAPSFARVPVAGTARPPHRHWRQPAAIAALLLVLLLQLLLADRARLAADARWRPLVATLCGALHCSVPAWREPAAFTLLHRDVRPHPTRPGVLQVSATFRNDARWPQPWPALLLTLADVDGRNAGARAFLPREYLDAAPPTPLLARGQSATVAMDILEPAPRIVAFTFDFR